MSPRDTKTKKKNISEKELLQDIYIRFINSGESISSYKIPLSSYFFTDPRGNTFFTNLFRNSLIAIKDNEYYFGDEFIRLYRKFHTDKLNGNVIDWIIDYSLKDPVKESTKSSKSTKYFSCVFLNKDDELTALHEVTAFNLVETKNKKTLTITSAVPSTGIEFNPNIGDKVQFGMDDDRLSILVEASCTEKKISKSVDKTAYQLLTFDVLNILGANSH